MPLRDHFRPPLDDVMSWEAVHAQWPAMIVIALRRILPPAYLATPRVTHGANVEYEVLICDTRAGRRLVAAVEIVSPANKDRPESRKVFVAKCVALLRHRVAVTVVDLVTVRQFNLYRDLLETVGAAGGMFVEGPTYAVSFRLRDPGGADGVARFESWGQSLTLGEPLPTLPLWLTGDLSVPLDLEATYEETCDILRIP